MIQIVPHKGNLSDDGPLYGIKDYDHDDAVRVNDNGGPGAPAIFLVGLLFVFRQVWYEVPPALRACGGGVGNLGSAVGAVDQGHRGFLL